MTLTAHDQLAIHALVNLHGHLVDHGQFERFAELFAADVVYDLGAYGRGVLHGIEAIVDAARALGDANPVAHHVTNIVIEAVDGMEVSVVSKGIGVRTDGTCGSVVYHDIIRRETAGWRIARRRIVPRLSPLEP